MREREAVNRTSWWAQHGIAYLCFQQTDTCPDNSLLWKQSLLLLSICCSLWTAEQGGSKHGATATQKKGSFEVKWVLLYLTGWEFRIIFANVPSSANLPVGRSENSELWEKQSRAFWVLAIFTSISTWLWAQGHTEASSCDIKRNSRIWEIMQKSAKH